MTISSKKNNYKKISMDSMDKEIKQNLFNALPQLLLPFLIIAVFVYLVVVHYFQLLSMGSMVWLLGFLAFCHTISYTVTQTIVAHFDASRQKQFWEKLKKTEVTFFESIEEVEKNNLAAEKLLKEEIGRLQSEAKKTVEKIEQIRVRLNRDENATRIF